MKVLEKVDATASLAEYTANLDQEPVIITSSGKPIAALVPIGNMDLEIVSLSTNPQFLELIERSRSRHRAEGGISSDEMRRKLGLHKSG
jgi:prevent-host-death family protein